MSESDDQIRTNIRETFTGLLRTLADPNQMREYSLFLGGSAVGEVYCQWFDDLYHPDEPVFQSAFIPEVLEACLRVNAALVACKELAESDDIEAILRAPSWNALQSMAQQALRLMGE